MNQNKGDIEVTTPDLALVAAKAAIGAVVNTLLQRNLLIQANHVQATNPGALGPANQLVQPAPAITTTTGKVRVTASASIAGGGDTSVAGDPIQFELLVDGAFVPATPVAAAVLSSGLTAEATLQWVFTVAPGAHTFSIQATNLTAGHTMGAAAGNFSIGAQELAA